MADGGIVRCCRFFLRLVGSFVCGQRPIRKTGRIPRKPYIVTPFKSLRLSPKATALVAIEERLPDLVVTDIRMPKMDGYALLAHLRDQHPDLPVLAISGYVSPQDIDEYDFDGFIEKPTTVEEFRQIVWDAAAEAQQESE